MKCVSRRLLLAFSIFPNYSRSRALVQRATKAPAREIKLEQEKNFRFTRTLSFFLDADVSRVEKTRRIR